MTVLPQEVEDNTDWDDVCIIVQYLGGLGTETFTVYNLDTL